MDSWGRPLRARLTVDGSLGVPAVREAILTMMRGLNVRTGNGHGITEVMPVITGTFVYETERDIVFMSAMWSLVRDGIIVPGSPAGMSLNNYTGSEIFGFQKFTITPFGREYLTNTTVIHPLESAAYMEDARKRLGGADEVVFTYLASARQSFADRNYLSAIVMLGVSSEMLMKWLIARFIEHLPEAKRESFEKTRDRLWARTDKLFDSFITAIKAHFNPDGLTRDLELQVNAHLDQLQTLIRVNRDDVGHGRPERADEALVNGSLQIYLPLLSIVRELADELKSHRCVLYGATARQSSSDSK
jgi:hypothetical protein